MQPCNSASDDLALRRATHSPGDPRTPTKTPIPRQHASLPISSNGDRQELKWDTNNVATHSINSIEQINKARGTFYLATHLPSS